MAEVPDLRRLVDIVASLETFERADGDGIEPTIFAERPWHPATPAVVLNERAHYGRAPSKPSYAYLLEVDLAVEVLRTWTSRRSGSVPSPEQGAEAVIHYAAHDDHLPATCHLYGCGRPGAHRCDGCGGLMCVTHAEVSAAKVECEACSRNRPAGNLAASKAAPEGCSVRAVASGGLQLGGVLSLALGWLLQSEALIGVGACLLVVGGSIWLGAFVMRTMD